MAKKGSQATMFFMILIYAFFIINAGIVAMIFIFLKK